MTGVKLETATISNPGGRSENQDVCGYAVVNGIGCWVLADGLGGHGGGAIAARIAVDSILAAFRDSPACTAELLERSLDAANRAVCDGQGSDPKLGEMRTTVVVLLATEAEAIWAHTGDSRLYYFSGGRIRFQTKDHSVPQAMSNAGQITPAQIRFHEDRNRLLRSIGNRDNFRPAIEREARQVGPGDAFLLASDGLWEYVTETEMEVDFAKAATAEDWLKRMEARLRARASGEHDNYSGIAVFAE